MMICGGSVCFCVGTKADSKMKRKKSFNNN